MSKKRSQPSDLDPFALKSSRVHEAEGQGRFAFAAYQMGQHAGAIYWINLEGQADGLLPQELHANLHERVHFVEVATENDLLWATEEALRAEPVGLVITLPEKPLSLTVGRRLQLAAEAGQTTGLILIREGQGSNAAETRWKCEPLPSEEDSTLHHWLLNKNKSGTLGDWIVSWDGKTPACHMVEKVRK